VKCLRTACGSHADFELHLQGTTFSLASVAALVGIPIAGAILQANGGVYTGLIVFAGAMYLAAFVAFLATRVVAGGWTWSTF
jgi:hypothetical protein